MDRPLLLRRHENHPASKQRQRLARPRPRNQGPSGSGKTTLLNAIAGSVKASKKASLTGTLLCDGKECGGASQVDGLRLAYVQQEDIFYTQMTVRETLLFAARLRLPQSVSRAEKERRVDELIDTLGLRRAADTIIGDVRRRGISGGERKRLSIGCELLSEPSLLFLDEPTSGLDSFAAQQVMKLLRKLASSGVTVISVIHQPRGSIYNLFDDLILVAQGHVVYNGAASNAASHFRSLGYPCPSNINAGEHVVDIVSKGYGTEEQVRSYDERLLKFEAAAKKSSTAASASSKAASSEAAVAKPERQKGAHIGTQFTLLFRRAWREVARSKAAVAIKVAQQVMVALVYGGLYTLGDNQASIQDRFGLLSLVAIGAGNLAIASTIRTFPKEKAIVSSERAKRMYGVPAYFGSKVVAEAPVSAAVSALGGVCLYPLVNLQPGAAKFGKFVLTLVLEGFASGALGLLLGAVAPSTDTALAMFPPLLVLMIVFNGFNLAEENAPRCLRWIPQVRVCVPTTTPPYSIQTRRLSPSLPTSLPLTGLLYPVGVRRPGRQRVHRPQVHVLGADARAVHRDGRAGAGARQLREVVGQEGGAHAVEADRRVLWDDAADAAAE